MLDNFTQGMVEEQMQDYLPPVELPGLEKKMRIGIHKLLSMLNEAKV